MMFPETPAQMLRAGRPLTPTVLECGQCRCVMEVDPRGCENSGYGFEVICPHCGSMKRVVAKIFCSSDEDREEAWGY